MLIKNKIISLLLALVMLISLSAPFSAEVSEEPSIEVDFTMRSQPKYIFEMTAADIKDFFEKETRQVIFNPATTTTEIGMLKINGNYQLKDVTILSFKITDAKDHVKNDIATDLQTLMSDIFDSATKSIMKKQVSTCIYTYACDMKMETLNGELSNAYMNIAFYFSDSIADLESKVIKTFVRPKVNEWAPLTNIEKIMMLNAFILNGQFSYDTDLEIRKSTVKFLEDKEGVCEEYAGLTALFLDEMGFENIVITGRAKDESGTMVPHTWNMVKIDGQWYHLDILWNGPIDKDGKHISVNEKYLLKSTKTFSADHSADAEYLSYTKLATKDYTKTEDEEVFNPSIPGLNEREDEILKLINLLNEAYDIIANHAAEYTQEDIKNLNSIYSDAYNVYINENSTVNDIKTVQAMLTTAMSSLTKADAVNKDNLFYTLGKAYEMLFYPDVAALYPASSLRDLEKVYNNAVKVYQDENATQNKVNSANWTLWSKVQEIKDSIKEPEIPVEPTVPVEPTDPVEPDNPTNPDTPEPTDPVEPGDPTNPEDPVEPVDPVDPNEPDDPTTPIDPVDPEDPVEPSVPVDPVPPVDPIEPSEPTEPINPVIPGDDQGEENKISTDIIIYVALAVLAAGGIVFLIIDSIRKRKENAVDEEDTTSENEVSESAEIQENTEEPEVQTNNEVQESAENSEVQTNNEVSENAEAQETETSEEAPAEDVSTEKDPVDNGSEENDENFVVSPAGHVSKKTESEQKEQKEEIAEPEAPIVTPVITEEETQKEEQPKSEEIEEKSDEEAKAKEAEIPEVIPVPAEEEKPEDKGENEVADKADAETAEEPVPDTEVPETESEPEAIAIEEVWEEKSADDILEKPEEISEEEKLSVVQIQEDIEANRKSAVNILKQIKKRKKEIKDNEKK
ncbi:MAG: hypothetical protein IJE51_00505 [Clostridia bacterium]|nr:hypothetical protein [Clostridia bacterium]